MFAMKGYIVEPTYKIIDGKPVIELYGRLDNGESFLSRHDNVPYFFIKKSDLRKAKEIKSESTDLKNFAGEEVIKVIARQPAEIPPLRKELESLGIETYEADIRFAYRFLIDNDILNLIEIEGDYSRGDYVERIYDRPTIRPAEKANFNTCLKVLSIDIETDGNAKKVFSIAMYTKNHKEVLIVADEKLPYASIFKDERSLLLAFTEKIKALDPDVITGWNLIDFDLKVLQDRCRHHKVPFVMSRDGSETRFRFSRDYFSASAAESTGRAVLDGINLLKMAFVSLDDYKLDTAAKELIGKKKTEIEGKPGKDSIERLYRRDKKKLVEYNLNDAALVYDILDKRGIIDLVVQKTLITGLPLERARGSVAALDMLYIRKARKRGLVCPTSNFTETEEKVKGAYVMEPKFGIYEYILVLDFKSLYPSIIRTFNIDPASHSSKGTIVAPNGARFKKEEGILPEIIQGLYELREKAKREKNDARSYAIKIIMNSFYGVLANPTCRFYSLEVANAITGFAREIVQETASEIRKMGYEVIYGDTDSVFVVSKAKSAKEAEDIGKLIQAKIDEYYTAKVERQFGRKSYLNLEFDKLYKIFLLPKVRGQEHGAKKRYAGLLIEDGKEKVDIVGLEFVRRDWTDLAKDFQMGLLDRIFHNKDIEGFIKDTVKKLKEGKLDKDLVYRKAIRKDLDEYTKTTPPHVRAARMLDSVDTSIIEYYITENGPEPLQKHKSRIDYGHYVEKQLRPIAESILVLFGKSWSDVVQEKGQKCLGEF